MSDVELVRFREAELYIAVAAGTLDDLGYQYQAKSEICVPLPSSRLFWEGLEKRDVVESRPGRAIG